MKSKSQKNKYSIVFLISMILLIFFSNNLWAQNEILYPLFPNGIKNNPIKYDQPESYVDSLVSPGSLSGKNRVYSYVSEPAFLLFPAKESENKHIGLVVAPGGGLRNVWLDKEGIDIAMWLSGQGISCMVLKYRVNHRDEQGKWEIDMNDYMPAVEEDAKQAILTMRAFADSLDFDSQKVGMMGFSAGGWLTEGITIRKIKDYATVRPAWMPDFAGLIYHVNTPKFVKDEAALKNLPPMFMAAARNDFRLGVLKNVSYLTTILENVEKSELHIYNSGGHGFGTSTDKGISVAFWKVNFLNWMLDVTED